MFRFQTGDYNVPYHVQYIATGVPQPMVFMPPCHEHAGLLYAMPQVAAPLIVQQGKYTMPLVTVLLLYSLSALRKALT